MIKLKDLGDFNSVTPIVESIISGNISELNAHLAANWDINEVIEGAKYLKETPLTLALTMANFDSVRWLTEHGADLNAKGRPCFLTAVRYCDKSIVQYVVEHGAKVNEVNHVKSDAFEQALYGGKIEHLQLIHELGHSVQQYGGNAFRNAVNDRNYKALDFFIKNGVDINYNKPDMVYPFKPTPLCVAVRYADLKMCKYLVKYGADVTMPEGDGMRPYSIALEKGDTEIANYFKSLEPIEFHSLQNKLDELKLYKLPKNLLHFLQTDNLHIDVKDCGFGFIDFFSLTETVFIKLGRQKLLRISKATGDYNDIIIVWNPKTKKIAYYDMEHGGLCNMCSFEEFIGAPSHYLQNILDGKYSE